MKVRVRYQLANGLRHSTRPLRWRAALAFAFQLDTCRSIGCTGKAEIWSADGEVLHLRIERF